MLICEIGSKILLSEVNLRVVVPLVIGATTSELPNIIIVVGGWPWLYAKLGSTSNLMEFFQLGLDDPSSNLEWVELIDDPSDFSSGSMEEGKLVSKSIPPLPLMGWLYTLLLLWEVVSGLRLVASGQVPLVALLSTLVA